VHAKISLRGAQGLGRNAALLGTLLRSPVIGCWMGITPGGATAASFMSYSLAKRFSKRPDNFGKGEPKACRAGNRRPRRRHRALLPMLALGIPGSATAAVMLGGLMIWGLQPGADAVRRAEGLRLGPDRQHVPRQCGRLIMVLATVPLFAAILRIPFSIIAPMIVVVCAIGAYCGARSDVRHLADAGFGVSAMSSRSSTIRSRRWCWPGAGRQGRGCVPPGCSLTGNWAFSGPTHWWAA
jgi:putative tricarboxylic transport membrane protein